MDIVYLDQENVENYTEYLTRDEAENIGRTFHHGLVVTNDDDEPVAAMIWKIRNTQSESENESQIVFLKIDDEDAVDLLFENYVSSIEDDEVVKSTFSLPAKTSSKEKTVLLNEGFTVDLMEGDIIRSRLSEVADLPLFKKIKPGDNVMTIGNLANKEFYAGIRRFVLAGFHGLCEDLAYLSKSYFENDVSCYVEGPDGQISGFLLFHKTPSGALSVVIMAYMGNDYSKYLPQMMAKSLKCAMDIYSPDTEILIDRHNYSTLALAEKLFPSGFGIPIYEGEREE